MSYKRFRIAPVCLCLAMIVAMAKAEAGSRNAIGTYERTGRYWQQVKITPARATGRFRGSFDVKTPGCIGEAVMEGRATGPGRMLFSKKSEGPDEGVCNITIVSADAFRSITVSHDYCPGYYGAACDFNGSLKRTR